MASFLRLATSAHRPPVPAALAIHSLPNSLLQKSYSPPLKSASHSGAAAAMCYSRPPIDSRTLQWVAAASTGVLMIAKGTSIQKSLLVPLFILEAPGSVLSWIKGDYGIWTAFLLLLIRLFYFIPGGLELPLTAMLLAIAAPREAMNLRGAQGGVAISLALAALLAFQHFTRVGSLRRALDQGTIIGTLAVVLLTVASFLLLL